MYRHLNSKYIVDTLKILKNRIYERFPNANLNNVCQELLQLAAESEARIRRIRRPRWLLRLGVLAVAGAIIVVSAGALAVALRQAPLKLDNLAEVLQGLDAGVNELILLSVALVFLVTLEDRLKRAEALRALHDLRSIAHVIDMHQLSKDPETIHWPTVATASSPHRHMTPFELFRYLDYCAELLSLTSKVAALYVQYQRDPVVISAVSDVENLASGLSQKIWQKITMIEGQPAGAGARGEGRAAGVNLNPEPRTLNPEP
jgi:hypothetical protein